MATIVILFFSQQSIAQDKLKITPLAGDLYVYTTYKMYGGSPFPSNSMYLVTAEGVVLFDTPWDSTQFQPLLDSIEARHNRKVIMSISTHYHADRTAGADYYSGKGIKTWCTALTKELCRKHNEKEPEFAINDSLRRALRTHGIEVYYPGEGHTKDNIVIWLVRHKVLYGGCLVKSTEAKDLGNIADANLKEWPSTIKRLIRRYPDINMVVPGHFGWSKDALEHTLKLLQ